MGQTKISVIIPVYNAEDTVSDCIHSILNQSLKESEIIIINDGSTDLSLHICNQIASKHANIRVISQTNKGPAAARSTGIAYAKSEWIAFVDADDALPSNALALLYAATSDSTEVVFGNGFTLGYEHRKYIPIEEFRHLAVRGEGTIGVPWGALFKKESLPSNAFDVPQHIRMGEDYIFWLRVVFAIHTPISIVYGKVYQKGHEHISSSFRWTAEYAYELNQLRMEAIPQELRPEFMSDTISDRITNLFDIAVAQSKQKWLKSDFYKELEADMKTFNVKWSIRQKAFLMLPSISLRRLTAKIITHLPF